MKPKLKIFSIILLLIGPLSSLLGQSGTCSGMSVGPAAQRI